jgi:hypothetical protein
MSRPTSLLFVGAEIAVVLLVVLGGRFLFPGFMLAIILLLIFSGALISLFARQIQTSCNCFGSNEKLATQVDLWRDAAFVLCALGGGVLALGRAGLEQPKLLIWFPISGITILFVLTASFLGDIVQLFH